MYIHENYATKELNISHPSLEMTWVQVTFHKTVVLVGSLYRPPNENIEFWPMLEESLETLQGHDIILMGDLNVNTMDPRDPHFQHLRSINHSLQLHNIIRSPTRITATSSKCIDVILSNNDIFSNGSVEHLPFTDHALVYCVSDNIIEDMPQNQSPQLFSRRQWQISANRADQLETALSQTMAILEASGINRMWEEWKGKFLEALDQVAPVVTTRASLKKRRCPWMTPELLNMIHRQKSVYRKVIKSDGKDADAVKQHRLLRSQSHSLYRRLKNVYFRNQIDRYKHSPQKFWNTINYITGRRQQRHPPTVSLSVLVNHFKTLLYSPVPTCQLPLGPDGEQALCQFRPVTPRDVEDILMKLNLNKAPGPDGIRPSELRLVVEKISGTLSILFNESLATGEFPLDFKTGNIIPLLKPGKKDNASPGNYRGITLNNILSKVLEKLVLTQVTKFLEEHQVLDESQYGFRRSRSTVDLLTTVVDDWLLARDKKLCTAAVFIDLSKAFDNVNHQKLLHVLHQFQFGGLVLKWFQSYLEGRSQRIVLGSSSSESFGSSKGVPQGSVLGPLLFNIYVSDLAGIANRCETSLPSFADDMTLYCSRRTPQEACRVVSAAMRELDDALTDKGLVVNNEKTVSMIIQPVASVSLDSSSVPSAFDNLSIQYKGNDIMRVSKTRLLGVTVDDNLSWNEHVDSVCLKLGRKVGALRRAFRQLTPAARRQYLLSVIQPDLEYASTAIVPSMSDHNRERLLKIWRRAVRCAAGLQFCDSIAGAVLSLRLTPLEQRWALQFSLTVRQCYKKIAPAELSNKLSRPSHAYGTRGRDTGLQPLLAKSRYGVNSFSYRAPLLWNYFPPSLKHADCTRSKFKLEFLRLCSTCPKFSVDVHILIFGSPHRL